MGAKVSPETVGVPGKTPMELLAERQEDERRLKEEQDKASGPSAIEQIAGAFAAGIGIAAVMHLAPGVAVAAAAMSAPGNSDDPKLIEKIEQRRDQRAAENAAMQRMLDEQAREAHRRTFGVTLG